MTAQGKRGCRARSAKIKAIKTAGHLGGGNALCPRRVIVAVAGHLGGPPIGGPVRDLPIIDVAYVISAEMPMA